MGNDGVLDVAGVGKSYGATTALVDVDLEVGEGEVCGLLGPNGAGKTTLVSIIAGLRTADTGTVRVGGVDVATGGRAAREMVGLASQETSIYPTVTVRANLEMFGRLAGLGGQELARRIDEVAEVVALTELVDRPARHLSGGEKRRVHTAMALIHRPRVLLLDEPTTGVDIGTRSRLLAGISLLAREEGCAVLYSTHYLPEVEELGASVAILDHGRILARGPLDRLIDSLGTGAIELAFDGPAPAVAGATVDGSSLRVAADRPGAQVASVLAALGPAAERLLSVNLARPNLEAVFQAVTGRAYHADEPDGADGAEPTDGRPGGDHRPGASPRPAPAPTSEVTP